MDDMISRQVAIGAINKALDRQTLLNRFVRKVAIDAIEQLPPAQPKKGVIEQIKWERDVAIEQLKKLGYGLSEKIRAEKDCISRQAVKEMIKNHRSDFGTEKDYRTARACVNAVPPAQPEIIRCKDCKHWIPYDWMFSEVWRSRNINDYPEDEIGCKYCDMAMKANDFCSRAERKEVTE